MEMYSANTGSCGQGFQNCMCQIECVLSYSAHTRPIKKSESQVCLVFIAILYKPG